MKTTAMKTTHYVISIQTNTHATLFDRALIAYCFDVHLYGTGGSMNQIGLRMLNALSEAGYTFTDFRGEKISAWEAYADNEYHIFTPDKVKVTPFTDIIRYENYGEDESDLWSITADEHGNFNTIEIAFIKKLSEAQLQLAFSQIKKFPDYWNSLPMTMTGGAEVKVTKIQYLKRVITIKDQEVQAEEL
jgi:hypothetical protein